MATAIYMAAPTLKKSLQRVKDSLSNRERSREDLKAGIAGFYDRSSKLWEDVWGEHMHHGYVK
jgi:tocopherol O-methyltransferase